MDGPVIRMITTFTDSSDERQAADMLDSHFASSFRYLSLKSHANHTGGRKKSDHSSISAQSQAAKIHCFIIRLLDERCSQFEDCDDEDHV
jgi:hypothetical protein